MARRQRTPLLESNAYNLFILVLTVMSLVVMVVMLLPFFDETIKLLEFYDNLICLIFLVDFAMRMHAAHPTSQYFFKERGWLDLLGSIPSLGLVFKYSGILRLARISRLARIVRLMKGKKRKEMAKDVLENRGKYALFITVLTTILVLGIASELVLAFEVRSPDASITTGWNSFWYSIVTITTVGYGDYYPVTVGGRIAGMFIMVTGLGIIGALASMLASLLVGGGSSDEDTAAEGAAVAAATPTGPAAAAPVETVDLAEIKQQLAEVRAMLERLEARQSPGA